MQELFAPSNVNEISPPGMHVCMYVCVCGGASVLIALCDRIALLYVLDTYCLYYHCMYVCMYERRELFLKSHIDILNGIPYIWNPAETAANAFAELKAMNSAVMAEYAKVFPYLGFSLYVHLYVCM